MRWRDDEAPLARERFDHGSRLGLEVPGALIESMQMQAGLFERVREDVFFKTIITELWACEDQIKESQRRTHLGYRCPAFLPQDFRKLLRRPPRSFKMMREPALTGLSMAFRSTLNRAYRMLRGDQELGGGQCGNEDDASVRFKCQGVWWFGVGF